MRGDLILAPNVPAMVAPGDEFAVSVSVVNNAEGATGPVSLQLKNSAGVQVLGDAKTQLTIAAGKEGVAQFKLRATDTLGAAALEFSARIADKQGKIAESISVRPALPFRTQSAAGRSDSKKLALPLARDLYREYRKVEAAYGYSPLVWSHGLTAYLHDYPYSCTEQLLSQGIPALLFTSRPELGKIEAKNSFAELIQTLRARQNDEGAFGLWASSVEVDAWPSIYAVHFLIEARERGPGGAGGYAGARQRLAAHRRRSARRQPHRSASARVCDLSAVAPGHRRQRIDRHAATRTRCALRQNLAARSHRRVSGGELPAAAKK